jgi:hypothetical protein
MYFAKYIVVYVRPSTRASRCKVATVPMKLFGGKLLSLQQGFWRNDVMVTAQENEELLRAFFMEEIEEVLKDTKTDMTSGPDGFPVSLFKRF